MNFPTLFKITPEPFGLDLSDRSIKVVKLSKAGKRFSLENFGETNIEEGLMADGVILAEGKLIERIRHTLDNLKMGPLKSPYVSCSLPEQATYLRVVQIPKMKKEEVKEAIQWEIEANIPVSLSDIYFDWRIIPPLHPSPHQRAGNRAQLNHIDILVSAASRDIVDSYTVLFEKAGLKIFSFEPESIALARCLIGGDVADKPVLIVDLGQTRTNFIIYAGYGMRFTSSIGISEDVMTQNIARDLNVDMEKAESLKKEVGLNKDEDERIFEAIVPVMTDLNQQIKKYIDFYINHSAHIHDGGSGITKVILSGGGARLKGIEKYLTLLLKVPVERANPWINILEPPLQETPEMPYKESIRYTTVLGLALAAF